MTNPGTNIYRAGTTPQTRLVNTMRVRLFAPSQKGGPGKREQIGTLQRWNPTDTRQVTAVRGIGYGDQIAELSVGMTELRGGAEIMALYLRNILQSFGYNAGASGLVRSLKHHRWPFDVYEFIHLPNFVSSKDTAGEITAVKNDGFIEPEEYRGAPDIRAIQTIYEGCWMTNWGRTFQIGQAEVAETMECMITDVYASEPRTSGEESFPDMGTTGEAGIANSNLYPGGE